MSDYTSGDYVYFNDMIDTSTKNHIIFILNQSHAMYITSPLKIREETFESLPNLFVNKMFKNG